MTDGDEPGQQRPSEAQDALKRLLEATRDRIQPPSDPPPNQADKKYRQERDFLEREKKKQQLEDREHEAHVSGIEQYHKNRKRYTGRIFWLMVAWMVCVLAILVASGIARPEQPEGRDLAWHDWLVSFELSEAILLALIGSTSANVIGLFVIVARFLFPRDGADERTKRG